MQDRSPNPADHEAAGESPQGSKPAPGTEARAARRPWRWHRALRLCLEAGIGIVAGLIILGGIAVWRLSSEPVRLDFLTPYLEQAFNSEERGLLADVGETLLTWEGWPRNVDLRVRRLLLKDPEGQPVAFLPDVSVTLSLRALLKGKIAPTRVEVIRPLIVVERQADGQFKIGSTQALDAATVAPSPPHGEGKQILRAVIEDLLARPDPARRLSFLTQLRVEDAQVALRDRVTGIDWQASRVVLDMRRAAPGVAGELAAQIDLPDSPVGLEVAFTYDEQSGLVDLASSFDGLQPAALPGDWPAAAQVRGLSSALGGSVTATMSLGGRLDSATFDIAGGAGRLDLGDLLPEARAVRGLAVSGTFDGREQRIRLHEAALTFGTAEAPGPALRLAGEAALAPAGGGAFEGELRISDLLADELPLYWPLSVEAGGRGWITENLKTGLIESGRMALSASLDPSGEAQVDAESIEGELRYRDLDVHYLRPMPPVRGVTGSATFDSRGMRFKTQGGRSGDIEIGATDISIEGFGEPGVETMEIKFPASGPLRAQLELLNHPRLGLIDRLGLDPAQTAGTARGQTVFRFPLLEQLTFDEVSVVTQAELFDVAVGRMLLGKDARKGRLSLAIDKEAMWIRGKLELDGVPLDIDWRESFVVGPGPRSQYRVQVPSLDDAARQRFGFDVLEGLSGPISASLVVNGRRDGSTTVEAALNLEQAALSLPELYWSKAKGEAGEARFTLLLQDDRLVELRGLEAALADLSLSADGRFDAAGERLAEMRFDRLSFERNQLVDVTVKRQGGGLDIEIGGGVLNAEPFLDEEEEESPTAEAAEPPLRIVARNIRSLRFGEGRYLERVAFALDRPAGRFEQVQLVGQVPQHLWQRDSQVASVGDLGEAARDGRFIEINYRPKPGGGNRLDVVSNDAGSVLRALDLLDTMEGGELVITGERDAPGGVLQTSIEAQNFTMIDAPVLADILLVASLTGIVDALSSEGVPFERLVGDVAVEDGVATTELLRAYGGSLGITAKGEIDIDETEIDLRGTIVPIYGLNRLLGEIPVLGTILTGGEGEGFVAFTYDVAGDFDEPEVSVNPLSALAPGWLRGIFSGEGKGERPTVFPEGPAR